MTDKLPSNFFLIRVGELLISMSSRMVIGGLSWYCMSVLSNAALASMLYGGYFIAKLIFGLIFSPLGDAYNKKFLLMISACVACLASLIMIMGIHINTSTVWFAIGVVMIALSDSYLAGMVNAILPDILPKELLEKAYQHTFLLQSMASILGIASGVTAIETFGLSFIITLSLILTLISVMCFTAIKYLAVNDKSKLTGHYTKDILEGIKLSLRYKTELYWNIISALSNFSVVPLVAIIIPYFVLNIASKKSIFIATLELSLTLGVFIAATYFQPQLSKKLPKIMLVQTAFVGISVSIAALALSESLFVWHLGLLILGTSIVINNISVESMRAIAIPKQYRARLQIVHQTFIQSSVPLGFYLLSLADGSINITLILSVFSAMFFLFVFLIPLIPKMKLLLCLHNDKLEGAYERLF